MIDQIFTPLDVASNIFLNLPKKEVKIVADFAIGNGSLLKALPFQPKTVVGLDLDRKVIGKLRKEYPMWKMHSGDFIESNSSTKKWLCQWENMIDLIVLNPPFSCKGGTRLEVKVGDKYMRCRTALAFVLTSLKYLKSNGTLIAILPLSSFKSEADKVVLSHLQKEWDVEFGTKFGHKSFIGCFPKSIVLTLNSKKQNKIQDDFQNLEQNFRFQVEIIRGSTQMHKTIQKGKYSVIHSTNLKDNCFNRKAMRFVDFKTKYVQGIFLCIPRVGAPSISKLVIVNEKKLHILSDCVIGIRGINFEQTKLLKTIIIDKWDEFKILYESTCAPYITLRQICDFLKMQNIDSKIVSIFSVESIPIEKEYTPHINFKIGV